MSWPMVKLNDICRPKQWKTIASSCLLESGYPVYGANGKIGFYSEFTHELPTLMITCRGATCGNVHISEPRSYINGNAMALDDIDLSVVDIKYLYYFFLKRGFDDVISGSAQPQITGQGLTKVSIPVPLLAEQQRIAEILDKADAIRQKRQQAIKLADDFLRSVFLEMFGDPVSNPKGWDFCSLSEQGIFKNGLNFSREESGTEIYCIGVGDFKSLARIEGVNSLSKINLFSEPEDSYFLENEDLLFVRSNGNKELVGRCVTVHPDKERITFSGFCIRYRILKNDVINADYLNYCLRVPSMKNAMLKGGQGANIQNINQKLLSALQIPIPPIKLQHEFANVVSKFREVEGQYKLASGNDEEFFNSLSQKAFSGQL